LEQDDKMNSNECIFCKIVAGEIPAACIYEDDAVFAFLDIGPVNKGHALVIPKAHYEKVDQCPPHILSSMAIQMGRIAKAVASASACEGYNVLCNNGQVAGQVVGHVHFHIIPRFEGDGCLKGWPAKQYADGEMDKMLRAILENL
jgi:histidine triad (HIT) family protein